mgnify:CR=1 FL=1
MQRDVENVATGPQEPRRQSAKLVVLLEQQHTVPGTTQDVCRRHAGQAAADHNDIVLVSGTLKKIARHRVKW